MINHHKFINIFRIIAVILPAGWLVDKFNKNIIYKPVIVVLTLLLILSGFIDLFPIINDHTLTLDDVPLSDTASWIADNTSPKNVFLTTTYIYNPASLAGRKTWMDYGYFNWSLGYNDAVRKGKLPTLFSSTLNQSEVCNHLIDSHIDYVLIAADKGDIPELDPHKSSIAVNNQPTFTSQNGTNIYKIIDICQ